MIWLREIQSKRYPAEKVEQAPSGYQEDQRRAPFPKEEVKVCLSS